MNLVVASWVIHYGACEEKVLGFMDKTPAHLTSVIIMRKGADQPSFLELVLQVVGCGWGSVPKNLTDADKNKN